MNNDHFTIYRSGDGAAWTELLQRPGALNSQRRIDYRDVDARPLAGVNYYRLRQTDVDGQWTESHIVAVNMDAFGTSFGAPYPMPANDKIQVQLPDGVGTATMDLLDARGRSVGSFGARAAGQLVTLDVQNVPAGTYLLAISTGLERKAWPVIIAR